jgi:hypothetical protein
MSITNEQFKGILIRGRRDLRGDHLYFEPRSEAYTRYRIVVSENINGAFSGDGGGAPGTVMGVTGVSKTIIEENIGTHKLIGNTRVPIYSEQKTVVGWDTRWLSLSAGIVPGTPCYFRVDMFNSITSSWVRGSMIWVMTDVMNTSLLSLTGDAPVDPSLVNGQIIPTTTGIIVGTPVLSKAIVVKNTGPNPLLYSVNGGACVEVAPGTSDEFDHVTPQIIQIGATSATSYQFILTK